jgi:hypothetical protein
MKSPFLFGFCLVLFLAGCSGGTTAPSTDSAKVIKDSPVAFRPIQSPYPIMYSSSFVMDDPKNAESILALWKAYDAGNLATVKDLFADTVVAYLANGWMKKGSRDSTIAGMQGFRNMMSSVVDEVNAVMAVKSTDKNEHWVLIWGMEKDIYKNGKADSMQVQETWRFDDNGKANLMYAFGRKPKM